MRRLSFSHFDCWVDSSNWWRWLKIPSSHGAFVSCGRILSCKGRRVIRFRFGERNLYKVTIILNMKKTNTRLKRGESRTAERIRREEKRERWASFSHSPWWWQWWRWWFSMMMMMAREEKERLQLKFFPFIEVAVSFLPLSSSGVVVGKDITLLKQQEGVKKHTHTTRMMTIQQNPRRKGKRMQYQKLKEEERIGW